MADDASRAEEQRWLLGPESGHADIHIAMAPDAKLSPELQEAVENLLRLLPQEEVQGYVKPGPECPSRGCSEYLNCSVHGGCVPQCHGLSPKCPTQHTCSICYGLSAAT